MISEALKTNRALTWLNLKAMNNELMIFGEGKDFFKKVY